MDTKRYDQVNELCNHLWGKTAPYESIYSHSYKVTVAMEVLADYLPAKFQVIANGLGLSFEAAVRLSCYLAGVHDIGKIVSVWQGQEHAPEEHYHFFHENSVYLDSEDLFTYKGYRHEWGSYTILKRIWRKAGLFCDRKIQNNLAAVVLTHHQKLVTDMHNEVPGTTKKKCEGTCAPEWVECQEAMEEFYRKRFSVEELSVRGGNLDVPCMIMSGLLIFADWMGSSMGDMPVETEREKQRFRKTMGIFVNNMGVRVSGTIPDSFGEMWPWIETPRPLQSAACVLMEKTFPGGTIPALTIIEDSMGAGKTEAALFIANHIQRETGTTGLYIALPTAATANQMHRRVDELLDRFDLNGARLLHSTAWLFTPVDSDDITDAEQFLSPLRMGLFAPYGVGTIDQALMSVLKMRYGNLRMSGIAGKVLIVDEVHAYDAYVNKELRILLYWCKAMEVPVILLSATLPEEKRRDFISVFTEEDSAESGYPRITAVDGDGHVKERAIAGSMEKKTYEVAVLPILSRERDIAELALKTVEGGGTLCVNVNTVGRAIAITKILDSMESDAEVHIFHSRYSMARRKEIEDQCIELFGKDTRKRPKKAILVATQVVEQSLDIDFDYYITDICPVDLILQRMGRQFRHAHTNRPCRSPKTVVLVPKANEDYGASELIYDKFILDRTRELIESISEITVPDDIQSLVDSVYRMDRDMKTEWSDSLSEMLVKNQIQENATENTALNPPGKIFQFGKKMKEGSLFDNEAKTRLADPSVRIAILPEKLYHRILEDKASREDQQKAYEYSFSIAAGKYDYGSLPTGERMLKYVYLLQGKEKEYGPGATACADGIRMDARYGVIVEGK